MDIVKHPSVLKKSLGAHGKTINEKETLINTPVKKSNTKTSLTRFMLNHFEHILNHRALVFQQFHAI